LLIITSFSLKTVKAEDEIDRISKQIEELAKARQMSEAATRPLEAELGKLQDKLEAIQQAIRQASDNLLNLETGIKKREKDFDNEYLLLSHNVESYYKRLRGPSPLYILLATKTASGLIKDISYQGSLADEQKRLIANITGELLSLEKDKKRVEADKQRLASLQTQLDSQAAFFAKEIKGAKEYQKTLSVQIAQLSARQQELIAAKLASLNISRSAASMGRCDSDLTNGRDPGFSPKFAVFTYGVPNRVGLNQWGAYGRAKAGQGYDAILRAYYNFDGYQNFDNNIKINVEGMGSFSLEDYVKRIYEVPGDWPSEVLKAQAIAARSYVLSYTNNGSGPICATESCQVFQPNPKGGAWEQAVNDTSGKAMVQGGKPIKAWFSSTHGGYVRTSSEIGWSETAWTKHATDGQGSFNSFSDLTSNSYDRESPWFYCDWGSRAQFNKTAWLKPEELADIVNTIMLAKRDSGSQEHLYQPDKPPSGADVWDQERVKQELRSRGGNPYSNISEVSISADFASGRVTQVNVSGDGGSTSFEGSEFKNFFNLRAPANIQIVGPLYNVEKR